MIDAAEDSLESLLTADQLRGLVEDSAFAFRGYNVTNIGMTHELFSNSAFRPIIEKYLRRASVVCAEVKGRAVDLVTRVEQSRDTSLATYDEAVSMIVSVELAQIEILRELYGVDVAQSQVVYGFSLGEISALCALGILEMEDALRIPLEMSNDCVELAGDVTLGVLFSRRGELPYEAVHRVCQEINLEGKGVIGISAVLAPNSVLLIGQQDTIDRMADRRKELSDERVHLRRNDHRWPPLHTPIVWQRHVPNRSMHLMQTMPTRFAAPTPPIFSLATGGPDYTENNLREIIGKWVDHPQQLWKAVDYTLSEGVEAVIHIGPQPNIIPATFDRLSGNVRSQTKDSVGMRALSRMAQRPWLQALLPRRASLLRAPHVAQLKIEEWLVANQPG